MTVGEAARGLRTTQVAVRRWIASGDLSAFHTGLRGGTRISVQAVNKFIADRTFNSPLAHTRQRTQLDATT
jgi:excisionase family DNA binding protein